MHCAQHAHHGVYTDPARYEDRPVDRAAFFKAQRGRWVDECAADADVERFVQNLGRWQPEIRGGWVGRGGLDCEFDVGVGLE